jgi:predicted AAA+ superfamily ATPase
MKELISKSDLVIASVHFPHKRKVQGNLNQQWRMNGIFGSRGVGKTTLMLQMLQDLKRKGKEVLFVRLDDFYFVENLLYDLADEWRKQGGEYLYIDEVHKYPGWSRELKNIYDSMPAMKMVFSGSSIIGLSKNEADLSRRALMYLMPGLSFREYLILSDVAEFPSYSLETIFENHNSLAIEISTKIPVLKFFREYIRSGFYPFFLEKERDYLLTLEQVIMTILEVDFLYMEQFDSTKSRHILTLLKIVTASAPFIPNITKMSERTGLHRHTVLLYLQYLEKAGLIRQLNYPDKGISRLQKPDKISLDNPNLFYALNPEEINTGSVRESFAVSQLSVNHSISLHKTADFLVDDKYIIEIGGKGKGREQIKGIENSYIFSDDLEVGHRNRIPLWMLGFLY